MASNYTYSPDIDCFIVGPFWRDKFAANNSSITNDMVNFLNLTGPAYKSYLGALLDMGLTIVLFMHFCPNNQPDIITQQDKIRSEAIRSYGQGIFQNIHGNCQNLEDLPEGSRTATPYIITRKYFRNQEYSE